MNGNKELKVHSIQLTGRSLCSIRSNRKWCKRRGSSLQCQNCFFVYTISDCNLKNFSGFTKSTNDELLNSIINHSLFLPSVPLGLSGYRTIYMAFNVTSALTHFLDCSERLS